ncbi:podoplanin isoform X2 [Rhinoderma darwinii]|uniref:podoplanin isoform X2 n=1 Tax=Rhinoderma darwinii TaxID=43563 RepID=UPI003F674A06
MLRTQGLLCLLIGLSLRAAYAEVVTLLNNEAETVNITEKTFTDSTEAQTQTLQTELNVTSQYDTSTARSFTLETDTQSMDNTTYTVVIEDPEDDCTRPGVKMTLPSGLDLGTLVGIVAGIVSIFGISAIIAILIIRKMGRYSP